ncbi:MAG: GNAT family N-acetyltransferase [Nitrospirae bacterium]|nr:GNAT family N-acetyltransferase [Nitrospirota bacterium]
MGFSIRPAREDDIPRICDLLTELFSIEADFTADREKQSRGLSLLLQDRSGSSVVIVAERDNEVIGVCSVQTLISTAEGGPVGLLEDLIVQKHYRGNGIGTELLAWIGRWCMAKKIRRLQLLRDSANNKALEFYVRNGWNSTSLVCMRKLLSISDKSTSNPGKGMAEALTIIGD